MAEVAATIRNHGSANPAAVLHGRGPFTAADILASPPIVEPFHLLDLCLATEGAAAVVMTTAERARDLRATPVDVLAGGCEWYRQQYVDPPRYEEVGTVGADAARRAFARAGLTPADVDVAELYDINSFEVLRQLEALGFCGEGEGGDFARETGLGLGRRPPGEHRRRAHVVQPHRLGRADAQGRRGRLAAARRGRAPARSPARRSHW